MRMLIRILTLICFFNFLSIHASFSQSLEEKLLKAIEKNEKKTIRSLIRAGVDLNLTEYGKPSRYGFMLSREWFLASLESPKLRQPVYVTPLQVAAFHGDPEVVRLLLKAGANPHATDSQGKTALMYAYVNAGGESIAEMLIREGISFQIRDTFGNTARHYAAYGNNAQGLDFLPAPQQPVPNQDGMLPIHTAAIHGLPGTLEKLIVQGADPFVPDNMGYTPLHYAAAFSSPEALAVLLRYGKNPNPVSKDLRTPLDLAMMAENKQTIAWLKRKGARLSDYYFQELCIAVEREEADIVDILIKKGVALNRASDYSPLHIASRHQDPGIIKLLLMAGAEPNRTSRHGRTPAQEALINQNPLIAQLLIDEGAKIPADFLADALSLRFEAEGREGWNQLIWWLLGRAGTGLAPGGRYQISPLAYAAWAGESHLLKVLLEKGLDPNEADEFDWTPLHWAMLKAPSWTNLEGKTDCIRLLKANGADPANRTLVEPTQLYRKDDPRKAFQRDSTPLDILMQRSGKTESLKAALEAPI